MRTMFNKKKIIVIVLVILILTFCILYTSNVYVRSFFDKYIFRKNITQGTLPEISIENYYNYCFNDNIVCLEKNSLNFYNKSAHKISSLDIKISEPIFEDAGNFLCVAEKNGNKLYLIHNRDIVWQKDIEGSITDVSLNKNGYIAVSISDTTYKTVCKVFDNNGSELFTSYISKSYIIDSAISNDNKFLALAEINVSGIAIQSNIKIISIDKALSNSSETIEYNYTAPIDNFVVNIEFCNDNLVCLYDNHIDIIKDNTVSEVASFDKSNILFADINNKIIQVEKKSTGLISSEFELQVIDPNTLEKKVYTLDKEPKSINVSDNVVCVNFGTKMLFITNSGWLIRDYTSSQEIASVILSDDLAGILYKQNLEILSL